MMESTLDERIGSYYMDEHRRLIILPDLLHFRDPHGFVKQLAEAGFEAFNDDNSQSERDFGSRYRNYYSKPGWKTRCVECGVILTGWVEDDIPADEHCRAIDRFCSFVTGHFEYLSELHIEPAAAAQSDAAGAGAAAMDTEPPGEPEVPSPDEGEDMEGLGPAPGETCSSHQSKDKVRFTPCGHLWCLHCVNDETTLHEKCPVCLKPPAQIKVYEPETVVMSQPSLEQKRRSELARAYMFSRCDVCAGREKVVLLHCTDVVCKHYEKEQTCPTCESPVIGKRPPDHSDAIAHFTRIQN